MILNVFIFILVVVIYCVPVLVGYLVGGDVDTAIATGLASASIPAVLWIVGLGRGK